MKLIRLELRNFKGCRSFVLEPNGEDVTVFGDNGTFKTTLFDAFTWLLFGKDSLGRQDFEIKTLGPDGAPLHGLDHEVEAVLELPSGSSIKLRKVYREKWVKRRGSAQAEFDGHTTDHFVDGVPVTQSEFRATVASLADEETFRLLTDPVQFAERLPWQKRRELLLQVCGDVTDEDVIRSDAALAELPEILGGRTLEQHRKVVAARRAEINRELERIPVRIDEAMRSLPAVSGDRSELLEKLERLREERRLAEEERARIAAGGEAAEKRRRLREIESDLLAIRGRMQAAAAAQLEEEFRRLSSAKREAAAKAEDLQRLEAESLEAQAEIQRLKTRMDSLRERWRARNAQELEWSPDPVCPACGQPVPEERLEEARQRALADFNSRKAQDLADLSAEGKRLAARVAELEAVEASRREAFEALRREWSDLEEQVQSMERRVAELGASPPPYSGDPDYQRLDAERAAVLDEIESLRRDSAAAVEKADARVRLLDQEIAAVQSALSLLEQRERTLQRVDELRAEERRLAAEFEQLERQLYLADQFTRRKVELLEERINSRFALARFKLFDQQINGALAETCEVAYRGVPYGSLNHGARLNVGLDIINTLAEHFGFAPPVWIDNAESVSEILPTRGQQIRLVVSAGDKALRVVQQARMEVA